MTAATTETPLPITRRLAPATQDELVAVMKSAIDDRTPIYPIGGGTSLDFGLPAKKPGLGIETTGLHRIIDYPARDMTITVESGVTMRALSETLAAERQWLPIDVPHANRATIGGVVATNFSGPRRYGQGTIRDYVIGVRAVDGRGEVFQGGGRVVKNVAGYDFCKMLIGSLGTLGLVTQLTLKVKPRPEASAIVACDVSGAGEAEALLSDLTTTATTPSAIELVGGPHWDAIAPLAGSSVTTGLSGGEPPWGRLFVLVEGTETEVEWMRDRLADDWRAAGARQVHPVSADGAVALLIGLTEFPAGGGDIPLVLKVCVPPSSVAEYFDLVRRLDATCSIQAHAGDGVLIIRFTEFNPADVGRVLVGKLQATAAARGGSATVIASSGLELTRQATFGASSGAVDMMEAIRRQFDPHDLLNPGRYLYEA